MRMSFHIDVGAVSRTKLFTYDDEKHVGTEIDTHGIDGAERPRRVRLALEATRSLTDYANQARNATSGEPEQVLIVLDPEDEPEGGPLLRAARDARGAGRRTARTSSASSKPAAPSSSRATTRQPTGRRSTRRTRRRSRRSPSTNSTTRPPEPVDPLAKPSGITLADHRQHVYDEAESAHW